MAERANAQPFLSELRNVLGVPRPDPASGRIGPYRFERNVIHHEADGTTTTRCIDLYRRACFVCKTKQGAAPHRQASLFTRELAGRRQDPDRHFTCRRRAAFSC